MPFLGIQVSHPYLKTGSMQCNYVCFFKSIGICDFNMIELRPNTTLANSMPLLIPGVKMPDLCISFLRYIYSSTISSLLQSSNISCSYINSLYIIFLFIRFICIPTSILTVFKLLINTCCSVRSSVIKIISSANLRWVSCSSSAIPLSFFTECIF